MKFSISVLKFLWYDTAVYLSPKKKFLWYDTAVFFQNYIMRFRGKACVFLFSIQFNPPWYVRFYQVFTELVNHIFWKFENKPGIRTSFYSPRQRAFCWILIIKKKIIIIKQEKEKEVNTILKLILYILIRANLGVHYWIGFQWVPTNDRFEEFLLSFSTCSATLLQIWPRHYRVLIQVNIS